MILWKTSFTMWFVSSHRTHTSWKNSGTGIADSKSITSNQIRRWCYELVALELGTARCFMVNASNLIVQKMVLPFGLPRLHGCIRFLLKLRNDVLNVLRLHSLQLSRDQHDPGSPGSVPRYAAKAGLAVAMCWSCWMIICNLFYRQDVPRTPISRFGCSVAPSNCRCCTDGSGHPNHNAFFRCDSKELEIESFKKVLPSERIALFVTKAPWYRIIPSFRRASPQVINDGLRIRPFSHVVSAFVGTWSTRFHYGMPQFFIDDNPKGKPSFHPNVLHSKATGQVHSSHSPRCT